MFPLPAAHRAKSGLSADIARDMNIFKNLQLPPQPANRMVTLAGVSWQLISVAYRLQLSQKSVPLPPLGNASESDLESRLPFIAFFDVLSFLCDP